MSRQTESVSVGAGDEEDEEAVAFPSSEGPLFGVFHPSPHGAAKHAVVMVIGGPQTRAGAHRSYVQIARGLAREGHPVLRYDYPGQGDAPGAWRGYAHAGPSLEAARNFLSERLPDLKRCYAWALCDGAAACAMLAPDLRPGFDGLVLCNPYLHHFPQDRRSLWRYYYWPRLRRPAQWKAWAAKLAGRGNASNAPVGEPGALLTPAGIGTPPGPPGFDETEVPQRIEAGLKKFGGSIHFLLSGADLTAGAFDRFLRSRPGLGKALRSGRFRTSAVPGADHTFSRMEWKRRVVEETASALAAMEAKETGT